MRIQRSITIDAETYIKLQERVGRGNVSRVIEKLVKAYLEGKCSAD